jgi:N-acetylmuramoyl-L-alanine amidase
MSMKTVFCISARRRSDSRRFLISALVALTLSATTAPVLTAAPPSRSKKTLPGVRDVRFWLAGDTTRVAIEVSGQFEYTAQRIENPDRVFFDISPVRLALKAGRPATVTVGNGVVQRIRLAERKPGTIRVVFDVEAGAEYSVSRLANPERLMVEWRAKGSAKAPKTSKAPETKSQEAISTALAPAVLPSIAPVPVPAPAPVSTKATLTKVPVKTAPQISSEAAAAKIIEPVAKLPAPTVNTTEPVAKLPAPAQTEADLPEPIPATRNSNGGRSLTRVLGLKLGRVVIDPGHGGHDQGTHSKSGLLEKDLVLDVAKRLSAMLHERLGIEVVLTRTDDTFVALEERTRLANDGRADLFLSIHANSSPTKSVGGVETFYLNYQTGSDDSELASRENASNTRTIGELREVVSKIAMRAKIDESREFALRVQDSLQKNAAKNNKDAKDRGVKRAPFVVLIGSEMPSVLAEIGFLSNARDESLFKGDEYRDRVADALYKGIAAYAETLSRAGTQIAQAK